LTRFADQNTFFDLSLACVTGFIGCIGSLKIACGCVKMKEREVDKMGDVSVVRPSPIAGRWYEGDPSRLAQQIDAFLQKAHIPALEGEVIALIAPHAGHIYSGLTAAHAFKAVMGQERELVAVISPLHGFHPAVALTSAHQAYGTPLGTVWIDQPALERLNASLRARAGWELTRLERDQEHSLEIELPFLQRALKGEFKLLPVMLRSQEDEEIWQLAHALVDAVRGTRFLLVASTDLSHFFSERVANQLDAEMLRQISGFSPEGVLQAEHEERGFACGVAAVAAVMVAARMLGATAVEILHHSTSADETGDRHSVVGYGAAVILKK
jgi:AmmeMemoRadiSam system protein B